MNTPYSQTPVYSYGGVLVVVGIVQHPPINKPVG